MQKKIFASIPKLKTWTKDGLIHRGNDKGTIKVRVDNIEGFETTVNSCEVYHFDGEKRAYDIPFSHVLRSISS